jgi:hypothetical protein
MVEDIRQLVKRAGRSGHRVAIVELRSPRSLAQHHGPERIHCPFIARPAVIESAI